ncbi:unnamed protein product [Acanthoscelides obtectus]|uniref:CHHC U11-48K-type domain-containing protein n=1 Tax=Acanthoscelides obtectus TaxID=200917 RepID=A0A9P0PHQ8_ACAOB|nr:unnamed protein product [Acanthoscelides obtectus]CAK1676870.1 hypothetical protein AOBTE_LOCUS30981 [Acanthoscelides obtectus]
MEGPQVIVKCPFNPQHIMPKNSLQRHVIRCMVNYPEYKTCPYNALHRFRTKELLAEHMFQCDSKDLYIDLGNHNFGSTDIHVDTARNSVQTERTGMPYIDSFGRSRNCFKAKTLR